MQIHSGTNAWVEKLRELSKDTWLFLREREFIQEKLEGSLKEEQAEELCKKYDKEIQNRQAMWYIFQ